MSGGNYSSYSSVAIGSQMRQYLGVEGSLRVKSGVLLGGDTQLVVEGMMPDLLHVVPVGDDTVLDGVFQGEDTWC